MTQRTLFSSLMLFFCVILASGQEKTSGPTIALEPWILHAKLIHEVLPEYPASARANHIQGNAYVNVLVDENGKIKTASAENCPTCPLILNVAALQAIKNWEYQPTMLNGNPVSVRSFIVFRFQLEKEPAVEVLTKSESTNPVKPLPLVRLDKGNGVIGGIIEGDPPQTPTIAAPQLSEVPASFVEDHLIQKINPEYPQMARIAHVQGAVVLQCNIDKLGNVTELRAVSGHPLLIQSALDAVKKWKYRPFLLNGSPVAVKTRITVNFHM